MQTQLDIPIILRRVEISDPVGVREIDVLLDTGAVYTVIAWDVAKDMGYDPAISERRTPIPQKSRRVKEMELAGVHGMAEQLQREIQAYELARIQQSIHILRDELQGIEAAKLPTVIQKTLDVLEEVTHVLQPVSGS